MALFQGKSLVHFETCSFNSSMRQSSVSQQTHVSWVSEVCLVRQDELGWWQSPLPRSFWVCRSDRMCRFSGLFHLWKACSRSGGYRFTQSTGAPTEGLPNERIKFWERSRVTFSSEPGRVPDVLLRWCVKRFEQRLSLCCCFFGYVWGQAPRDDRCVVRAWCDARVLR